MESNDLLTLEQLCSLLQTPKTWVYRQTREKTIPFIKLGKYLRFYRPDINEWIKKQQVNQEN
jgi:excisionase family DNA binding protein